jgi:hypothetical protein
MAPKSSGVFNMAQSVLRRILCVAFGVCVLSAVGGCKTTETPAPESSTSDLGKFENYTTFVWPSGSSVHPRDHAALGEQMTQYGRYVGHVLHRSASGTSECAWLGGEWMRRFNEVRAAMSGSNSDKFCATVEKCFVTETLPVGTGTDRSKYCQYGNCGEGGHVGACLAHTYGFGDNEIRICSSENDHMFAMVKSPSEKDWCILDRWSNIGHYRCGVDWDKATSGVTVDGVRTNENWFQRVTCKTLAEFLR